MDTSHRCISVEMNDRQPFWPAMCQVHYRVTLDVAPNGEWQAIGFELADVLKDKIWHPIAEDHPLWPILARDVHEPKQHDEVESAIQHLDWTERNARTAGVSPNSIRGLVGHGIIALDPTEDRRAKALATGAPQADDRIRQREDAAALSLT